MHMRIGPGPVFVVEMIAAGRRWQTYASRAGLVVFLFAALALCWANDRRVRADGSVSLREYAELGATFATTILSTQLALVLLAAPAATAGAICIDKARGNLTLLMTTDLSSMEIVLGKLFARLMPVFGLVIASLPVMFATSLLGGVSGELLLGGFVVLVGATLASCAIALVFSVYVGKTHEALLLAYFAIIGWLLAYPIIWGLWPVPIPDWFFYLNPFALLWAPMSPNSRASGSIYWLYLFVAIGIVALSTGWIIWRLRPIVLHQSNRPTRRRNERVFSRNRRLHLLNTNPVRWYERHRKKLTRAGRVIWLIFILGSVLGSIWAVLSNFARPFSEITMLSNVIIVGVGLLLATVGAVTVLADERTRGNLDILFTTPLSSRQIALAKWRAAFAIIPKVLFLPALVSLIVLVNNLDRTRGGFFSNRSDPLDRMAMFVGMIILWTSSGIFLTSLGLWLATQIKQLGRAVGLAVTIYVGISIGWIFLVMAVSSKDDTALAVISASPIFTAAFGTVCMMGMEGGDSITALCLGTFLWSAFYIIMSAILLAVTLRIFDRKLGRISLTKSRPSRLRPHKPRIAAIPQVVAEPTPPSAIA